MKLAIQLYTLRDIIRDEETLADALLHLRQMGMEAWSSRGASRYPGSEGQGDRGAGGSARPELPRFTGHDGTGA